MTLPPTFQAGTELVVHESFDQNGRKRRQQCTRAERARLRGGERGRRRHAEFARQAGADGRPNGKEARILVGRSRSTRAGPVILHGRLLSFVGIPYIEKERDEA